MSDSDCNPAISIPTSGRLGGIDFGTVRMGIATCDPSQTWVTPFGTYVRRSEVLDAKFFNQLVESDDIVGWIVGLPIHCDGQESLKSAEVRAFAQWLTKITETEVSFFDERFTTAEARCLLQASSLSPQKKKKRVDGLAAHLILTHFLDSRRRQSSQNESLDDSP